MDQSSGTTDFDFVFKTALGKEIPEAAQLSFLQHAKLLRTRNQELNLTSIEEPELLARKLYYPSWKLGALVNFRKQKVMDLGSGAGFPGIPLAISIPEARFHLIDSIQKKIKFIQETIEALKLNNAQALSIRGEELLKKEKFDVIVAQAVKPTRVLLKLLAPTRNSFGKLILMKGKSWEQESSSNEERALGFSRKQVLEFSIPVLEEKRFLLCFEPIRR